MTEHDIPYTFHGRDEVEGDFTILYLNVLGMEVAFVETVFVDAYPFLHMLLHFEIFVEDECTAGLDEFGVVAETLKIGLLGTIDVEVVGVGGGNDAHPRAQPMERAVEFVGLDDHEIALVGQDVVGAVVLRDA